MHGGSSRVSRRGLVVVAAVVAVIVVGVAAFAAVHLGSAAGTPVAGLTPQASHSQKPRTSSPVTPSPSADPSASASATQGPLAGKVIGIDPGHNGRNGTDPAYLNQIIWNGRENETCDTTGTETDAGYTEARYNFNVALYLRADLLRAGAKVVLTRTNNDGVGPCVNRRAQILDDAHVAVAIDIHADGGPPGGRGFTVLEPVADGPNDKVIGSSDRFGADVKREMLADTPMPISDYYGEDGFEPRDDLAGLNLSTVPKVLLECGNMRNATDAQILTTAAFQQQVAAALAAAITRFLTGL